MRNYWQFRSVLTCVIGLIVVVAGAAVAIHAQGGSDNVVITARGGGTTIIEGGTGPAGGFVPVTTKVGFHAEKTRGGVTGAFECLALAPAASIGLGSGEFTTNAMYVTGNIEDALVTRQTAILTGRATITGLGAGTSVPFTFTVSDGGPGATATLVTEGSPRLVFHETLLDGAFEVDVKKVQK